MKIYQVSSLPLKDVIKDLADSFNVPCHENCSEFYLELPTDLGEGEIRGINFDNGLGIIIYKCNFKYDVRIDFTVDQVHPIKYIYSIEGGVEHSFANQSTVHTIDPYKCAIVSSEKNNGHIISFKKDTDIEVVSLEIDRVQFLENTYCELQKSAPKLQKLFEDKFAAKTFYHEGFFGLEFKGLLSENLKYKEHALARKFYLESISLQVFVNQLIQFEDDLLQVDKQSILRLNEINRIQEIAEYIKNNLTENLTVSSLSQKTGLNPNKLQKGFKHLYQVTVNEYVINTRLEKALVFLKNPNMNISEVSLAVGIESISYFSKIFKAKYNMTPKKYQQL